MSEPQQVEHQLDRVPGPVPSHVDDPVRIAHRLQQRPDPPVALLTAADEYLQRAGLRAGCHATNRSVQDSDAPWLPEPPPLIAHTPPPSQQIHPPPPSLHPP